MRSWQRTLLFVLFVTLVSIGVYHIFVARIERRQTEEEYVDDPVAHQITEKASLGKILDMKKKASVLVVEARAGLGNRIRVIASATCLAQQTKRELIIVWKKDPHANCTFAELFQSSIIATTLDLKPYFMREADTLFYDYDTVPYMPIDGTSPKHIYVRSGYVLTTSPECSDLGAVVRSLRPTEHIQYEIDALSEALHPSESIGVHIRMLTDLIQDIPGVQSISEDDPSGLQNMLPVQEFRRKCHASNFIPHVRQRLDKYPNSKILLISDSPEAFSSLSATFKDTVQLVYSDSETCRDEKRRSENCLQRALVEFHVLSKTKELILSEWSSASELISYLANPTTPKSTGCGS